MNEIEKRTSWGEENYFNVFSLAFLFIFLYYGIKNGIEYGSKITLFIWCLTVCTTPISSASVLLSFPIKIFTKIPMFVTKFVSSIISLGMLSYFYKYQFELINTIPLGRAFIKIIERKLYLLFLVSIAASIISSYILDNFVDYFVLPHDDIVEKDKLAQMILLFLVFVILNFIYFNILIKNKIFQLDKIYYFL